MTEVTAPNTENDMYAPGVRPVFTQHDRELRKNANRSMIDQTLSTIVGHIHTAYIEGKRSVNLEMCFAYQPTMTTRQVTQALRRQLQAWYGQALSVETESKRMSGFSVRVLLRLNSLEYSIE